MIDEAGKVYRSAAISEDITDRKHAEEELRLAKERLEKQMDAIQQLQSNLTGYTGNLSTTAVT